MGGPARHQELGVKTGLARLSRPSRVLRVGLLVVLATSASLAACSAKELDGGSRQVVFVREALAPPPIHASGACVYVSDVNAAGLLSGTADLGLLDEYLLTLLLESTDGTISTNVNNAQVEVREQDGTLIREFNLTTAGFVQAGGHGVVSFAGIDAPTRDVLLAALPDRTASKTVVIHVALSGTDPANGIAVSTPEFMFPVKVCNGCLVSFATGNDPTDPVQPNCLKRASLTLQRPCALGQDEPVPCELCMGSRPACDPRTP